MSENTTPETVVDTTVEPTTSIPVPRWLGRTIDFFKHNRKPILWGVGGAVLGAVAISFKESYDDLEELEDADYEALMIEGVIDNDYEPENSDS